MNDTINMVETKKNKVLSNVQSIITTRKITSVSTGILMLAIVGVFQFITLGCEFDKLFQWSFYLTLVYRTILVFLAYFTAINFLYDKCIAHPDIQKAISEFKTLTKLRDSNFSDFLNNVYNPRMKKEAWKNMINIKISKLETKCIKSKEKKQKKILKEIDILKSQLTDEYINENIDTLNVKYYRALESDFLGVELFSSTEENKTRIDYDQTLFKSVVKKIIPFILLSIVLGAVVTNSINKVPHEVIMNLLSDMLIIIIRIGQGAWDCPIIINSSYLIPYSNRIGILKEYINWSADTENTKAYKISTMLESENKGE